MKVAAVTGRRGTRHRADLALTAGWRRSIPRVFTAIRGQEAAFRDGEEAKIQVTADRRSCCAHCWRPAACRTTRSPASRTTYRSSAREAHSAGRKAMFARAEDLIAGIAAMQQERRAGKRKVDPEWDQIHEWLLKRSSPADLGADSLTVDRPTAGAAATAGPPPPSRSIGAALTGIVAGA